MKKSKIYTGGGDDGTTSLVGGHRVYKTHPRLEAYGTIDELNSFIGLLITELEDYNKIDLLNFVQHQLFIIGSYLATPPGAGSACIAVAENRITKLEQGIDKLDSELPQLKGFVLPGGCRSAALAHVCRTVCRRAERQIFRLKEDALIDDFILVFVNRLSDLLFVIARHECFQKNIEEIIWKNTCE